MSKTTDNTRELTVDELDQVVGGYFAGVAGLYMAFKYATAEKTTQLLLTHTSDGGNI